MGVCMMCVFDSEEREHGVGDGVNTTMMSETLEVVGLTEAVRGPFLVVKKTHEPVCMR